MKHLKIMYVGLLEVLKFIGMGLAIITGLLLFVFLICAPFYFMFQHQLLYSALVLSVDVFIMVYVVGFFTMEERAKKRLQTD